jgi:serralysin
MALTLSGTGTSTGRLQGEALRIAASRTHASPLATTTTFTLGGSGPPRLQCVCVACQPVAAGATVARLAAPGDYTDLVKKSSGKTINALLAGGNRWFHEAGASGAVPSATARRSLTYSFIESAAGLNVMDANGFQALGSSQRERVRDAFEYLSKIVNVSFTEVAGGGDLQFGSNLQAGSAGYARYPNEGSQVFIANNQAGYGGEWEEGSHNWVTLLHETAHALGLKHPGNYNAGGGGTPGPYLAAAADHRNNTLMSYKDAPNMTRIRYDNGSFTKSTVKATTYQAYDMAALQYLYGASTTVAAQSYSWQDGDRFTATLWNPNAGSEINLANQTGRNVVDLRAGRKSSIGIVDAYGEMPFGKADYAALKSGGRALTTILGRPTYTGQNNLTLAAGSAFTRGIGGSGSDAFVANARGGHLDGGGGDDRLFWTGGDLQAVGGEGVDTLLLRKVRGAVWAVNAEGTAATLTRTDARTRAVTTLATVQMAGIESVRFWNGTALKATGAALYSAPPGSALDAVA